MTLDTTNTTVMPLMEAALLKAGRLEGIRVKIQRAQIHPLPREDVLIFAARRWIHIPSLLRVLQNRSTNAADQAVTICRKGASTAFSQTFTIMPTHVHQEKTQSQAFPGDICLLKALARRRPQGRPPLTSCFPTLIPALIPDLIKILIPDTKSLDQSGATKTR